MSEGGESSDLLPNAEEQIRVTRIHKDGSKTIGASPAPTEDRKAILDSDTELKRIALSTIPNHEDGTEVAQIDAFFEREGLHTKPVKILTPEELQQYKIELKRMGYDNTSLNELVAETLQGGSTKAIYSEQLGLTFVVKLPEYEDDFGKIHLIKDIAHEKAHSTQRHNDITYIEAENGGIRYVYPRSGHILDATGQGLFFEEGFAEYMAARFIRNELDLPNGAWPTSKMRTIDSKPLLFLPPVYVWPTSEEKNTIALGALSAYGLELLVQKEPGLHSALIEARTSVQGLRRVAQLIEKVKPGLYTELRHIKETPDDFEKGLTAIKAAVR